MHLIARTNSNAWAILGMGALALAMAGPVRAETPAQACDRLAADTVSLESIEGAAALTACSTAVAAAPSDSKLQYEYARALERSGKSDQAKQVYQWLAGDNNVQAMAALARMSSPLTGEAANRESFAQQFDAAADIAHRLAQATSVAYDDLAPTISQTGNDPAKILSWVRSNIRLLPYTGMLRGPAGVLMDRAGNSLDRSLFLAELLHRAGFNVRLASARLSPEVAMALLTHTRDHPLPSQVRGTQTKESLVKYIGADSRLSAKLVEDAVEEGVSDQAKINSQIDGLYNRVLPQTLAAIGSDPARDQKYISDDVAVLQDYFWVQKQNGAEWEDLDPDAVEVGKLVPVANFAPTQVPSELKHRVTLRVTIQLSVNGQRSEKTLLEKSWYPSEVIGRSITLTHAALPQPDYDSLLQQPKPAAAILAAVTNAAVIIPALQVGTELTRGQAYDFKGDVQAPTSTNIAAMGGTAILNGSALSSGIASVFGDTAPATSSSQDVVTAEVLQIDIYVPGKPLESHRRKLYDMETGIGAGDVISQATTTTSNDLKTSRSLALMGVTDMTIMAAMPAKESIDRQVYAAFEGVAKRMAKDIRDVKTPGDRMTTPPIAQRLELPLWAWSTRRSDRPSSGTYIVSPSIALLWQGATQAGVAHGIFDIVSTGTHSLANFSDNIAQGIYDSVLETQVFSGVETRGNASSLMAADGPSGRKWRAFNSSSTTEIDSMHLSAAARNALKEDIAGGNIVVMSPDIGRSASVPAWWRVNITTGATLSVDAQGRGTSMVEYADLLSKIAAAAWCLYANDVAYSKEVDSAGDDLAKKETASAKAGVGFAFCLLGAAISAGTDKAARAMVGAGSLGPTANTIVGIFGRVANSAGGFIRMGYK